MTKKSLSGKRLALKISLFTLLVILTAAAIYLNSLLDIITGYAAKNLASATYVSGRDQADVEQNDLNFSFIALTKNKIDREKGTVTSRFLWGHSTALYREGFGVTLLRESRIGDLQERRFPADAGPGYSGDTIPWPAGNIMPDTMPEGIDIEAVGSIAADLVDSSLYGGNAYAFMVLKDGVPVAERYREGIGPDTRLLSWSMAKSVTNALTAILVRDGLADIGRPVGIEEWKGDNRESITLNDLLQMQSGLEWNEDYGNRSDVTVMLHEEHDFAKFAYSQKAAYEPGTHWYYSSGTTNIVSSVIRAIIGNDDEYYLFPHRELFYPLGITDAVFETDEAGNMVGSSYLYMTARDYARFALLYMNDGVFNGRRILPEGWVAYSVTPAANSNGAYGAFFWLNGAGRYPSAPSDLFMCIGHDGQRIFMLPSQNMVVVVLGYSPDDSMDFNRLLADLTGVVN